jgi:hypothetical protein
MQEWQKRRPYAVFLVVGLVALLSWVAASRWPAKRGSQPADRPLPQDNLEAQRANRPNIVLVVYDARRRDDFSFGQHGNRRGDTRFLADLANRAV